MSNYTSHDATGRFGPRKLKIPPKDAKTISLSEVEGKKRTFK